MNLAEFLAREADGLCCSILHDSIEWVDVEIRIARLREVCLEQAPDKMDLFEGLYVRRFHRFWEQWRKPDGQPYD